MRVCSINSDPFFDPKRHADVDPDGLDEMEVIDGIQSRIHEKLQPYV